ncbi:hypothetical protein OF83DRAFT_1167149 [Amylostereum chailletii]|nr:hypothetical protein OF83DRAFT_1167149 [Amylostereum chailletii]
MPSRTTQGVTGTQSPPLSDSQPMGASSVRGGNAGGISDREQRAQYFDEQQPQPGKGAGDTTSSNAFHDATASQDEHGRPRSLWESAPTASGPFKEMSGNHTRDVMHEGTMPQK